MKLPVSTRLRAAAACALAVLGRGEVFSAAAARPPVGQFTIPRLAAAPVLDGRIEPGEWDDAFLTSGLFAAFDNEMMTVDTAFGVGWLGDRLYFLARCRRAPGEWRLTKGARFNDDYDYGDPSIEIWVSPPKRVPETYQNVINTYPAVMDNHQIPSRGYTGAGWKGNWAIGVTEDPDQYVIEASVPVVDFGVERIADGDVWRLLLARTAHGARPRSQGSWSYTQAFAEIPRHPPVTFRADAVAVRLEDAHTLLANRYRIPLTLVAPRGRDAAVTVEFRWHGGSEPGEASDIVETRKIALKAGGRETLVFEGEAPEAFVATVTEQQIVNGERKQVRVERKRGVLTVSVAAEGESAPLYRQSFAYTRSGWEWRRPERPADAPPGKPLSARIQYGPESHALVLRADILHLPEREHVAVASVRVLDPAAGERELLAADLPPFAEWYSGLVLKLDGIDAPLWDHRPQDEAAARRKAIQNANEDAKRNDQLARERHAQAMKRWQAAKEKDAARAGDPPAAPPPLLLQEVPPLPEGPAPRKILVEVVAKDAAGNVLAADRQAVNLLRHRFSWQGTDAGLSDTVIPPWTPVEAKGSTFRVWNRALDLDGLGTARRIDNGGVRQIRAMRLVATLDGKDIVVDGGTPSVGKRAEAWAEFSGQATVGGLALSAASRLEFDGCLVTDFTYGPAPGAGTVRLDGLRWEVELPADEATHYCATAGGWAAVHDALPDRWTSRQTGSGMIAGDFVPYIWLNNGERAFLWFADSDKGWITERERAVPTQEIVRDGDRVTLTVRFVETPAELTAARTLRHGWMTFPSRPLPAGSRAVICAQSKEDYPGARFTHFWFDGDWAVLWPYYCSPFPWSMERSKALFDQMLASRGPDHRPCVGSIGHSIGRYQDYEGRTFGDFAVDWGEMPGQIGNSDVTQSQGPIDFRLHHYRRWVREAGFKGLYIDENYLSYDRNPLTGGAHILPDGRTQPGYSYLGLREYFKRMMVMFHQEGVARPNLWMHITGGAAYHAWFGDILMEGENVEPTDEEWDYLEVLPPGRMIAIGSPLCNGSTTIMMCQAQRHPTPFAAKHVHQFVGWVMAHDILPEGVRWYGPIAQAARLHADAVSFHGYWRPGAPAKTADPGCLVSTHRTADRALLWVVNTTRADREVAVAVDWQTLGLDRRKTVALNAETGTALPLAGDSLRLPVAQRDFAAVLLVRPRLLADGESFRATFEKGIDADEAIGCEMLVGAADHVPGDKGMALSVAEREVRLWGHLNLRDAAGSLRFRGRTGDASYGPLVRTEVPSLRGVTPLAPPLVFERRKGAKGEPDKLVLRLDAGSGKDAPPAPSAEAPLALAPGWHAFELRWTGGTMTAAVDGKETMQLAVPSLNLSEATGAGLLTQARFVFGGPRAALDAIDDLSAWRK